MLEPCASNCPDSVNPCRNDLEVGTVLESICFPKDHFETGLAKQQLRCSAFFGSVNPEPIDTEAPEQVRMDRIHWCLHVRGELLALNTDMKMSRPPVNTLGFLPNLHFLLNLESSLRVNTQAEETQLWCVLPWWSYFSFYRLGNVHCGLKNTREAACITVVSHVFYTSPCILIHGLTSRYFAVHSDTIHHKSPNQRRSEEDCANYTKGRIQKYGNIGSSSVTTTVNGTFY